MKRIEAGLLAGLLGEFEERNRALGLTASAPDSVVGERTAGSTGQPLPIGLPFGGHARVCTKRDTYPDGREFVGVGIIPDVEVHPRPADIAAGRDVVLAKGVEVLKGQFKVAVQQAVTQ